ncbi:MAG: hypothetical protein HY775_00230 [Acidobacteria bacterium]|nr:hypothetical protein [Acidobacteriota bacterium]
MARARRASNGWTGRGSNAGGTGQAPADRASLPVPLEDLRRGERIMLVVRAVAVPWVFLQVLTYSTLPFPPGVRSAGLGLASALGAGEIGVGLLHRRTSTLQGARRLALASLMLDVGVVSGFVWVWAFDQVSALWAILFILPLEGAIRFRLPGALGSWLLSSAIYVGREVWGSRIYDYRFQSDSVSFRLGIGLLIALVAGLMARDLHRQRAELATAYEDLARVDRIRSGLVTTLAHDVRGPLTVIGGALHLLADRRRPLPPDRAQALLESARHQAERLERLSADLLDLARLEHGQLELSPQEIPLGPAVERALGFADPEHAVEVSVEPGLRVKADPARLEQVLVNLATNALRHGSPPFRIEAESRGDHVEIAIRDHGPGVPEDRLDRIFEPFAGGAEKGSVGFGLAIVRSLALAQGGDVSCEPNLPTGACFRLTIPTAQGGAPRPG